jgi:dodecin
MAILKVIEVLASSKTSWEDAAQSAVKHASKSVRHIKSCNISNFSSVVDTKGKITEFRVNAKITFEIES